MPSILSREDGLTIWTVGHSTRSFEEFLALLEANRIEFLADVRHFATSQRAPWAKKTALASALAERDIGYEHFEALGGFRKAAPDSMNKGWQSAARGAGGPPGGAPSGSSPPMEPWSAAGGAGRTAFSCASADRATKSASSADAVAAIGL